MSDLERLRYPVGRFQSQGVLSDADRARLIDEIESAPRQLRELCAALTPRQIEMPYRPDGWRARQVVHHLADSHVNAYARFRLALTEEAPVIKPYIEAKWAELEDARVAPVELSIDLLAALHARWTLLLRSLRGQDWARTFVHPEFGTNTLDQALAKYAWHGRHHIAHVCIVRDGRA
jgi:hypothetical protein